MLPHALKGLLFVERFYSYPVVASTSDIARAIADAPTQGMFVFQADRQTAGRGRSGALFFSNSEGGLWASIVTRPASIDCHFNHNRALSLAIAAAAEAETGRVDACSIKWPNDIYWVGRKLCGILLENHLSKPDLLVLGFGINVNLRTEDFPPELRPIATSLFIETGKRVSLTRLLRGIIERYHANIARNGEEIHAAYTRRLYGLGRRIAIESKEGVFDGVEPDGRLRLRQGREVDYMLSGQVIFLP